MPDAPRPYRVWGYPATSILFIAFASIYVVFTLYTDIRSYRNGTSPLINSLMGLVWVALGIPGYLWWSLRSKWRDSPGAFHPRNEGVGLPRVRQRGGLTTRRLLLQW